MSKRRKKKKPAAPVRLDSVHHFLALVIESLLERSVSHTTVATALAGVSSWGEADENAISGSSASAAVAHALVEHYRREIDAFLADADAEDGDE